MLAFDASSSADAKYRLTRYLKIKSGFKEKQEITANVIGFYLDSTPFILQYRLLASTHCNRRA